MLLINSVVTMRRFAGRAAARRWPVACSVSTMTRHSNRPGLPLSAQGLRMGFPDVALR